MPEITKEKFLVQAHWDDVPHLTAEAKARLLRDSPQHLRDARSKGIPALGIGAIYKISEDDFVVKPFEIPPFWRRGFGMDVGWNKTAVIWGALDGDSDILYLTTEHYQGEALPAVHAEAIKTRGVWIPGEVDPAANGRSQSDGEALMETYKGYGLNLVNADNAVEAGIFDVQNRLETGRLKVFSTCQNWLAEYRLYHRDKNGKIVRAHNHLMDATRYLCRKKAISRMITKPVARPAATGFQRTSGDPQMGY